MKTIDYSPNSENTLIIVNYMNNGILKLFRDGILVYNSGIRSNIFFEYVSFSHDSVNVIFTERTEFDNFLKITPLVNILNNNIELGSIFSFNTDHRIIDFKVSKNSDILAICFTSAYYYTNSILGTRNVSEEHRHQYNLNVYDYINHRLLFENVYDRPIQFSLSEINTIAVSSHQVVDDITAYTISIYDLVTGNRLNNLFLNYDITFIVYLPEIEPYYNRLLIIAREQENIQMMKIFNLEENFRQIYNKEIGNARVNTVNFTIYGQIFIGTESGLVYFSSFQEEEIPSKLFNHSDIKDIIFSKSGNKMKVSFLEYSEVFDQNYLEIHHLNLVDEQDNIPIENLFDDIPVGNVEDEEEIVIQDYELDEQAQIPSMDQEKFVENANKTCFDPIQLNEETIGKYLSSDPDNIVIFYKEPSDTFFLATCLSFTILKKYLKTPEMIFFSCINGKDFRTYYTETPEYLKIPTGSQNIFVSYPDIKQKYMERQNMIFLENSFRVKKTITYDASITMKFIGSNHCQNGSIIDIYRIIF